MGKALNYFLNDYEALKGYLASGHLEIDNNLIENFVPRSAQSFLCRDDDHAEKQLGTTRMAIPGLIENQASLGIIKSPGERPRGVRNPPSAVVGAASVPLAA